MREVIGLKKHHGRIALKELSGKSDLFAVGALEGLSGEVTIVDGAVIATQVNSEGMLKSADANDLQATLLVGGQVPSWQEHFVEDAIAPEDFDEYLTELFSDAGLDVSKPILFTIHGSCVDSHLHVINGECPVHSRLHGQALPTDKKPYEATPEKLDGTVVGVLITGAAGVVTHPGTATHAHVVFKVGNGEKPELRTAHLESVGIAAGATIRFSPCSI